MRNTKKSFLKKFRQRKKIYGISSSFVLFFAFVLSLLIFFSHWEYINQTDTPITEDESSRNEYSYNFYNDGLLGQKVKKYQAAYDSWIGEASTDWTEYKQPSETTILIKVNDLFDLDEKNSTIYAKGFITAWWDEDSIKNIKNDPSEIVSSSLFEKSMKDILSTSYLNFFDSENQLYKNVLLSHQPNERSKSIYEFSGRFKLDRDLRSFPFDLAKLKISLSSLHSAYNIRLETTTEGSVDEDRYRYEAFIQYPAQCYEDSYYSSLGIKENIESFSCNYDFLRPLFTIKEDNVESDLVTKELYDSLGKIDFRPISVLETYFMRSPSSSFFRYILPLIAGVSVLLLTENLSNKFQEIKVATPPTVLLTFIFMQNGYLSEIPQLSYITYMDKLYFLSYCLAILQLANALVTVDSRNKIERFSKRYFKFSFDSVYRFSFLVIGVFAPLILFFYF